MKTFYRKVVDDFSPELVIEETFLQARSE